MRGVRDVRTNAVSGGLAPHPSWDPKSTRPLAKPVQIVGVMSIRAAANTNRDAVPSHRDRGARIAA